MEVVFGGGRIRMKINGGQCFCFHPNSKRQRLSKACAKEKFSILVDLFLYCGLSSEMANPDHRRLLTESQAALERTSASLARSNQLAIETEYVGSEVRILNHRRIFFYLIDMNLSRC